MTGFSPRGYGSPVQEQIDEDAPKYESACIRANLREGIPRVCFGVTIQQK